MESQSVMQDPIIRHTYVHINRSIVHIAQYGLGENLLAPQSGTNQQDGSFLSSTLTKSLKPKPLIIFIPGNPGTLGIYHDFLLSLFRTMSCKSKTGTPVTILAMGHNNFDHPSNNRVQVDERIIIQEKDLDMVHKIATEKYLNEPHHMELQVYNKLIILDCLVKIHTVPYRIAFIGHSIGCYVIMRLLLDKTISEHHKTSILIHPALENMTQTQKGSQINTLFGYKLDIVAISLAYLVDKLMPNSVRRSITRWFCKEDFLLRASSTVLDSIVGLTTYTATKALIEMAKSEFERVRNLDLDLMVRPHVDKLKLVYAENDHWVNPRHPAVLKERFPGIHIEQEPTLHAFVMEPDIVIDYAIKVSSLILQALEETQGR